MIIFINGCPNERSRSIRSINQVAIIFQLAYRRFTPMGVMPSLNEMTRVVLANC
jgi:hypothetical protein